LRASEDAKRRGFTRVATIVDSTAAVAGSGTIEGGSYVNAGAIFGRAVKLGAFAFINRGATIGHHSELLEFVPVDPGATNAAWCG
jgi:UDP-3-O-[3-hydroxymyristoyl] glucosamine N-acyltransferase